MSDDRNPLDRLLNRQAPFRPTSAEDARKRLSDLEAGSSRAVPVEGEVEPSLEFSWTPAESPEMRPAERVAYEDHREKVSKEAELAGVLRVVDELRAASERMQMVLGRAHFDGKISVTVDRRGYLTGLKLDPRIRRAYTAQQIGPAITAVIQQAERESAAQQAQSWAEIYPESTPYPVADPSGWVSPEHI